MKSNDRDDMRGLKWDEKAQVWRVRVSVKDPRTGARSNRKDQHADLRSALRIRDDLEQEVRTGQKANGADPTLGEYAKSWLELKMPDIPGSTPKRYENEIRNNILSDFVLATGAKFNLGRIKVRMITRTDLLTWRLCMTKANKHRHWARKFENEIVPEGRTPPKPALYSKSFINGCWRTLKQILHSAVIDFQLSVDPTMEINPLEEPARPRNKMNTLEGWEVGKLLEYAREHQPYWYTFMFLGFHLGMRQGELRPLRWGEDIDVDAATILVQQSQREDYLGPTKGKEDRAARLPSEFVAVLRAHREWLRVHHPGFASGLVFPGYGGWRPWHKDRPLQLPKMFLSKTAFDQPLREMCDAVGIKQFVSSHVMRRTFNTVGDELKIDASIIRSFTGHKSEEMRMLYTDVKDHRRVDALAKIHQLYSTGRSGE